MGLRPGDAAVLDGGGVEGELLSESHTMNASSERGFSLIELLVATLVLLIVMSVVMTALNQSTKQQQSIWNRTEMHSGVRGATELMQQEVGQAGRAAMGPDAPLKLAGPVPANPACNPSDPSIGKVTVGVTNAKNLPDTSGIWGTGGAAPASYALITTLDGLLSESVLVYSKTATTIDACFTNAHNAGTVISTMGSFGNGIIPPSAPPSNTPNGSTANVMKMFGDINGDGNMVYVEYTCDAINAHKLYRNSMPFETPAAGKLPLSQALVLLNNVQPNPPTPANPGGEPCFTYQMEKSTAHGSTIWFVTDVAITLTVQTQQVDPVTKQFQMETKALLNVSPRNVYNGLQLANIGYTDRIQSTPATVAALLVP
jgi:prepilin-type N-terminal cleavage/methylation domain-containing protein